MWIIYGPFENDRFCCRSCHYLGLWALHEIDKITLVLAKHRSYMLILHAVRSCWNYQ